MNSPTGRSSSLNNEINVTPMIDVLLVLLTPRSSTRWTRRAARG
jgi:hypothetical protein